MIHLNLFNSVISDHLKRMSKQFRLSVKDKYQGGDFRTVISSYKL